MAVINGYCTLDEFKKYHSITSTNADDDTVIERVIESVSRTIDKLCKRIFYQVNTTKYYTAINSRWLFVDDIYTASGLTIYTNLNNDGLYEYTWSASDYELTPYSPSFGFPHTGFEIAINGRYSFSSQPKGNKITANFGWSEIPADIKEVCKFEVMAEYKRRYGENVNTATKITPAGIVMTPDGFSKNSIQKLEPYRKLI